MIEKPQTKIAKYIFYSFIFISLSLTLINSLTQLYEDRLKILKKIGIDINYDPTNLLINSLNVSDRSLPLKNYKDLELIGGEEIYGAWTAPFDWNLVAIHSILLPNEEVMTFGSYAIHEKEEKNLKENKKITLTDKFKVERDKGDYQWRDHELYGGVDFDIWDPKKGLESDSHTIFKRPIVLDAFCSVVRVFDDDTVFILGGNKEPKENSTDTQKSTTFYKVKDKKFIKGNPLNYPRWYGSIIRTANDEFIMVGGEETISGVKSITPEILKKHSDGDWYWNILENASSNDLFGDVTVDEWNYPRAFLASDGNVFGISYNKMWVMEKIDNDYNNIKKVGEIPLASRGGVSGEIIDKNPNTGEIQKLKLLTIGSSVGSQSNVVMIDEDKLITFGGKQRGKQYSSSNHVNLIDISNTLKPEITPLKSMNYPRADADATILPNGEVLINGGQAYNDKEFSIYTPEIYQPANNTWRSLSDAKFRRNYHSTSLLLPNGTVLTAGGDVWNAEIFYPPYLFEKDQKTGKTKFAKRPEITQIDKKIKDRSNFIIKTKNSEEINKVSIISTGSTTHAQSSELKMRFLNFKVINKSEISIKIDENKNSLQSGTYLVFLINDKGVPSEGKVVFLK
jgi:hypothetical protein